MPVQCARACASTHLRIHTWLSWLRSVALCLIRVSDDILGQGVQKQSLRGEGVCKWFTKEMLPGEASWTSQMGKMRKLDKNVTRVEGAASA